ncbi:MAG: hypothetical protein ACOC7R_01320 [Planctomycetota bacterium]
MNPLTRLRQVAQSGRRPRPLRQPARWRKLRQFAWVAFITILVWVWADLEQTTTQGLNVTLKVLPPPGSNIRVEKPDPEGVEVFVTVRGAQGRITELMRTMQDAEARGQETARIVSAKPDWKPTRDLDVLAVLNQWDLLRRFHVTAVDATPKTIQVETDRWVELEAQVELRTTDDEALQRNQMPPPPKVSIRVPESRLNDLPPTPTIPTEVIDVSPNEITPGENVTKIVALERSINGVPIRFVDQPDPDQPTAEVVLRVGSRTTSETLDKPVPVHLLIDPALMERITREGYVLSRDENALGEWQITLTLRGTRKQLEKVSADEITAFVRVTEGDFLKADTYPERRVEFLLPEGVTVVEPKNPIVHFKFVPEAPQP